MRRLESLILGMITLILIFCICTWSASPAEAQTCRDPVSTAAGEPTDPERIDLSHLAKVEGPASPTFGTQNPVLSSPSFAARLESFINLIRRIGIFHPKDHRP